MNARSNRAALLWAVAASLAAILASGLWWVSDAHGHGLASADARAIGALTAAGVVCAAMVVRAIRSRSG